jgi:hypothetical protein
MGTLKQDRVYACNTMLVERSSVVHRIWSGLLCALMVLILPGGGVVAENLLANPGFESLTADQPDRWDRFVQPKPGAVARLDDRAHSGAYSVWLHTPTPYDREPVNNWSQNIIAQFGGETLRVSGHIQVADAKEAALWLQCWRKRPWGVLAAASTSIATPVYGTSEWQEVSMDVDVPEGTDFVTLRCVLMGTGSAWFDDISLARVTPKAVESAAEEPQEEEPSGAPISESEMVEENPVTVAVSPAPEPENKAEDQRDAVMPLVTRLESEVRRLRDANVLLTDTLLQIQEVNQGLVAEVISVQAEIRALREEESSAVAPPLEPANPRVSPLIPLSEATAGKTP